MSIKNRDSNLGKVSTPSSSRLFSPERFIGYLLALPFSWPSSPYYWCSFLAAYILLISTDYSSIKCNYMVLRKKYIYIFLIIILALFSNIVNIDGPYKIDTLRIFSTSLIFVLFLIGVPLRNNIEILHGFVQAMFIWALLVIALAFQNDIFRFGSLLFSVPNYRLWGESYFPDWPNYFAFFLSLAFLLSSILFKRPIISITLLLAALLTTSRTSILAFSLFVFFVICSGYFYGKYSRRLFFLACIVLSVLGALLLIPTDSLLLERMTVVSDRLEIIEFGLEFVKDSIFFGRGAVLLDDSIGFYGFASFHNTYLDILVRYGIFALISFLFLISPSYKDLKVGGLGFFCIFVFFAIGSLFQNFLKHPHIIILFSIIMNSSRIFRR